MIKDKDIKEFVSICGRLNRLMTKINEYNPNANYYLANDTLNLMDDIHHDDQENWRGKPMHDNVVEEVKIVMADGGDW